MYVYNHRLRDKYGRMPVSLAVLGDKSLSWRPDTHREGLWGCEVRFTFRAVKLVDYKGRDAVLEADANPFAAVTLAHLKARNKRRSREPLRVEDTAGEGALRSRLDEGADRPIV